MASLSSSSSSIETSSCLLIPIRSLAKLYVVFHKTLPIIVLALKLLRHFWRENAEGDQKTKGNHCLTRIYIKKMDLKIRLIAILTNIVSIRFKYILTF